MTTNDSSELVQLFTSVSTMLIVEQDSPTLSNRPNRPNRQQSSPWYLQVVNDAECRFRFISDLRDR
jgi:hypothetical protein